MSAICEAEARYSSAQPPRLVRVLAGQAGRAGRAETAASTKKPAAGRPAPVRLTRRGRRLAGFLVVCLVLLGVFLSWLALAGGAQATNHGAPGAGHAGMTRVVVKPGQTLWAIAAAAEPNADPRSVIAEIMQVNALGTTAIQPGELLWVPRS